MAFEATIPVVNAPAMVKRLDPLPNLRSSVSSARVTFVTVCSFHSVAASWMSFASTRARVQISETILNSEGASKRICRLSPCRATDSSGSKARPWTSMIAWLMNSLTTSGEGWKPGLPMSWKVSLVAVASVSAGATVSVVTFDVTDEAVTRRSRLALFPDVGHTQAPFQSSVVPKGSWLVLNVDDVPVSEAVSSRIAPQL